VYGFTGACYEFLVGFGSGWATPRQNNGFAMIAFSIRAPTFANYFLAAPLPHLSSHQAWDEAQQSSSADSEPAIPQWGRHGSFQVD
jgi:hypothetical protein